MIRKATLGDMPQILEIYEDARKFMAANGNPTQWGTSHPETSQLEQDIKDGVLYVITRVQNNDIISADKNIMLSENHHTRNIEDNIEDNIERNRVSSIGANNAPNINKVIDIIGVFAFIIGEDSTYSIIDNGDWHDNETYGTIHRLAAKAGAKGIFDACINYCKSLHSYIRIDTHADNAIMHYNIQKAGFTKCGIIYAYDGSPRVAYDLKL